MDFYDVRLNTKTISNGIVYDVRPNTITISNGIVYDVRLNTITISNGIVYDVRLTLVIGQFLVLKEFLYLLKNNRNMFLAQGIKYESSNLT